MGLFESGQYTAYANYEIYFANQNEYDLAVAASGGNGFGHCPKTAATKFGITPFPPTSDALNQSKGIVSPIYSLVEPGTNINHPDPSGVHLSPSVDSVLVPGQVGIPAWGPTGPDMNLVWWGNIVKINGSAGENPSGLANIPQRRWICGFEFDNGSEILGSDRSREASRTIEGMGLSVRGDNLRTTEFVISNALFRPGYQPTKSWERFYLRVKSYPSANLNLWYSYISDFVESGGCLILNSDGKLSTASIIGNAPTVLGTTDQSLELNKWYKVDVILECNQSGTVGIKLRLWLNGSLKLTSQGLSASYVGKYHVGSTLCPLGNYNDSAEFDLDDWISSDVPDPLNSIDWKTGSHVRKHYNTAFGGLNVWDGNFEQLNQLYNADDNQNSILTNSNSGDILDGLTDVNNKQDSIGQSLATVAAIVGISSSDDAGADGTLGYSLAGASPVMASIDESTSQLSRQVAYIPSGLNLPIPSMVPFRILHAHSATTDLNTVFGLQPVVEHIGTFGPEDDPTTLDLPRNLHNCNYPNTVWASSSSPPDAPVTSIGGTYTGNGTGQSINLPLPCHFLFIRCVTLDVSPVIQFGCSARGHSSSEVEPFPNFPRLYVNSLGQAKFTVAGTNNRINANGETYQYIAFCDPGQRYNICGSFHHNITIPTVVNSLVDENFTPDGVFAQLEPSGGGVLSFKGKGNGTNDGTRLDNNGNLITNWGHFTTGSITSEVDLHNTSVGGVRPINYSAWRMTDGEDSMCRILSYVGNGASPRAIALTPTTGRYPLFGIVIPHNKQPYFRDPSHTGLNSTRFVSGDLVNDGIRAVGLDSFTVGSALNENGIIYEVFVILGGLTPDNGTFPTDNVVAPGTQWTQPVYNPPSDIAITGDGGLILNGQPSTTLLKDISGIYTIIPGQTHDTLYDRQTGQTNVNVKIPDPLIRSGYIGG